MHKNCCTKLLVDAILRGVILTITHDQQFYKRDTIVSSHKKNFDYYSFQATRRPKGKNVKKYTK